MLSISGRQEAKNKFYKEYRANHGGFDGTACPFCLLKDPNQTDNEIIKKVDNFFIIKNKFPYDYWDNYEVEDHLLIVPMIHAKSLNDLSLEEKAEWFATVEYYESQGYSIYSRSPRDISRSVVHQHTHAIKNTKNKIDLKTAIKNDQRAVTR